MKAKAPFLSVFLSVALLSASVTAAAPLMQVDSAEFDMGKIKEGTQDKVTHTFRLKNVGDEAVVIKSVKPG